VPEPNLTEEIKKETLKFINETKLLFVNDKLEVEADTDQPENPEEQKVLKELN
jgi:hypothetical protein